MRHEKTQGRPQVFSSPSGGLAQSDRSGGALKWLRTALRNLDEEATYIAKDNPVAAQQVVQRVLNAVAMLKEQPGIGRPGRVPGTRELIVLKTRYVVPYRVRGESVEILRVFHSSPDAQRIRGLLKTSHTYPLSIEQMDEGIARHVQAKQAERNK